VLDAPEAQASLEAVLKDEIIRMYQEVAETPNAEFHFYHGRDAAELFGYDGALLDSAPVSAVNSFAGVGNPHLRSNIQPGETVLDLGSGAGLDAIIAAFKAGPSGKVIGVDLNPSMCRSARASAAEKGAAFECREGRMEDIPVEDASVDVVISNGVINLSFRKRRVIEEVYRVLKPAGRLSITDIVSGKQLSQSIVNDPKLWAS
jgi:arsenite methyltransferase